MMRVGDTRRLFIQPGRREMGRTARQQNGKCTHKLDVKGWKRAIMSGIRRWQRLHPPPGLSLCSEDGKKKESIPKVRIPPDLKCTDTENEKEAHVDEQDIIKPLHSEKEKTRSQSENHLITHCHQHPK